MTHHEMKSNTVLLQLKLDGIDEVIDIHRVSAINADIPTIFIIERVNRTGEDVYRLTYNARKIPDLSSLEGITFIRQK